MKRIFTAITTLLASGLMCGHAAAETVYGSAHLVEKGRVVMNGKIRDFNDFKIRLDAGETLSGTCRLIRVNGDTMVVVASPRPGPPSENASTERSASAPGERGNTRRIRLSDFKDQGGSVGGQMQPALQINSLTGTQFQINYDR